MLNNIIPLTNISSDSLLISFLSRTSTRTQIIYITVVLTVIIFLVSMPFIKVSLSIQGVGFIRPITEKTEVKSLATEIIEQVYVHEGQFVEKGTPILKLRTDNISSRIQFLKYQHSEIESYISDLLLLTRSSNKKLAFKSSLYQQEYYYLTRQNEELQNKLEKSKRDYNRNKKLYDNGVVSALEFEDYSFQYASAQNEIKINDNNQVNKWQSDLVKYQTSLSEINSNLEQLNKEQDFYTIRAPISGNIEQFSGIYQGSTLRTGETVAIISPDSTLISEIYVSTKDIGYLNKANKVRIQVDAFNYNEWGILQGNVKDISSDFVLINNIPMFRVRCSMNKNYLSLQNGIRGYLKKGMTIRGRFGITERSLFQMLYQGADDWLNPAQYVTNINDGQ